MRKKRILIAAGGTGGHFYPGFALAKALKERGWQPLIALKPGGPADKLLEDNGIGAAAVDLEGLPRSLSLKLPRFGFKLVKSAWTARRLVADFEPGVVLGMGGYVSVPCLLAARLAGIPSAAHESNAILGLANKLCRSLGAKIFWGLPPFGGLKNGETLTGTPIRVELRAAMPQIQARQSLGLDPAMTTLLIFGGSQGAAALNRAVPAVLKSSAARSSRPIFQVLHISGEKWLAQTRAFYAGVTFKSVVLPYIGAMEQAYGAADAVICRAGASTLAELFAQKKPAILIPYPHAAAGHQLKNASVLEKIGAAAVVEEERLEADLLPVMEPALQSAEKRRAMSESYSRLALPTSSETVPALVRAIEALAA
ncbi:MAG TPA: undecaprenyldiphospho-muramoylpentapeptide beta-N-acetylglucosaminyltransferase [Elusimicrobiota bacterium]|nr:undecaprenyldiphospho-muramoylpentapeptide beta-N-acetylglucosaminyltransferase [Elusimicrobiota bacterium]